MSRFEYSFDMRCDNQEFVLTFHDFKDGIIAGATRDNVILKAREFLDDKIYALLKSGETIPVPMRKVSADKKIAPSDALVMALQFHFQKD